MAKVVYRYAVVGTRVSLPLGAVVLKAGPRPADGELSVWALVDEEQQKRSTHTFLVVGTGHPVPEDLKHVSTYEEGPFVWHIFTEKRE